MYFGARFFRSAISFLSLFYFAFHLRFQQPLDLFTPLKVTPELDQDTLSATLHRQNTENSRVNPHFATFSALFFPILHILQKDTHFNLWGLSLYVLRHPQEQLGASKDTAMLWRCGRREEGCFAFCALMYTEKQIECQEHAHDGAVGMWSDLWWLGWMERMSKECWTISAGRLRCCSHLGFHHSTMPLINPPSLISSNHFPASVEVCESTEMKI